MVYEVSDRASSPFAAPEKAAQTVEARVLTQARTLAAAQTPVALNEEAPSDTVKGLLPAEFCLEHRVLPLRKTGDTTLVATPQAQLPAETRQALEDEIGSVLLTPASETEIQDQIAKGSEGQLIDYAETRVPADLSCRDINKMTWKGGIAASVFFGVSLALIYTLPRAFFIGVTLVAICNLVACLIFKFAMLFAGYRKPNSTPQDIPLDQSPIVSLLVPVFKEEGIVNELIARLSRLSYPRGLLDVVLIVERFDRRTRNAIAAETLPPWMRVVVVPDGRLKTKPRALNYALGFTRGDIIGILDAEDAPATDQIERVVEAFHNAPKEVACVQGILDFYNTQSNWIARCFTIEYAQWFRVILAGAARIGLQIPLGGTTVYLRRHALQEVGAWDAHNVTEDADLGVRLARFGYQTILLPTVTKEEANNRVVPWIKQRSRWLKGYMITYIVHMRRPFQHWRQVGTKKFIGLQVFFLTTILQFTLAPALWCFWLVFFGIPTPVSEALDPVALKGLLGLFLTAELMSLVVGFFAVARTQHRRLMQWVPMMMFYHPMGVFAVYKAISELVFNPFYWDKTRHGVSSPDAPGVDIHSSTA